jgi:ureidoglycolate hydrolase
MGEKLEIKITQLTNEGFKVFGEVVEAPTDREPSYSDKVLSFWAGLTEFQVPGHVEIGVATLRGVQHVFRSMERHRQTPEFLVSMDGRLLLPLASPNVERPTSSDVHIFDIPPGKAVLLFPGCWHAAPMLRSGQKILSFLCLFQKNTFTQDIQTQDLGEEVHVMEP